MQAASSVRTEYLRGVDLRPEALPRISIILKVTDLKLNLLFEHRQIEPRRCVGRVGVMAMVV